MKKIIIQLLFVSIVIVCLILLTNKLFSFLLPDEKPVQSKSFEDLMQEPRDIIPMNEQNPVELNNEKLIELPKENFDESYDYKPSMVKEFNGPEFPSNKASRKIDWSQVETKINALVKKEKKIRVGYFIKDLTTNYQIEYNADELFASASLVKLPLAISVFKAISKGIINPNEAPVFEEKHRIGGSGYLKTTKSGRKIQIQDLMYLMLARSDNTATNVLTDLVTMDFVNQVCKEYGWKNTNMAREVMELKLRSKGIENWTSARDMASMMEHLYYGKIVTPEASNILMKFMTNPPIADRIPRFLQSNINVVHKTGLIFDNAHDVGIIYLPGNQPVILSIMVDNIGTNYLKAKNLIGKIARIIYDESVPEPVYKSSNKYHKHKKKYNNFEISRRAQTKEEL